MSISDRLSDWLLDPQSNRIVIGVKAQSGELKKEDVSITNGEQCQIKKTNQEGFGR